MKKNSWIVMVCMVVMSAVVFSADYENTVKDRLSEVKEKAHDYTAMEKAEKAKAMKKECTISGLSGTLQSADAIIGCAVHNTQGEQIGSVEELVLDENRHSIEYVVVDANDVLHPVPWTAFDKGKEAYTLDITSDKLRQAPTVSSLEIRQFMRSDFRKNTHDYYSDQISAVQDRSITERAVDWVKEKTENLIGDDETPQLLSLNEILGYDVQDEQGKVLGELDDVVFDVRQGNLAYGLVKFGGVMGIGQRTAAVPWEAIEVHTAEQIARLDADEVTLRASVLPDGDIRHLSEPTFAQQVHREYGQEPYWEVFGFVPPTAATAVPESTPPLSSYAWRADSAYNKHFNAQTVSTFDGTIKKVASFVPEEGAEAGLKLKIQTQDGRTLVVHAGPQQHYLQQKVRFRKGDRISVTGSRTWVEQKNVILASQVRKGEETFRIRDSQGKPAWQMEKQQQTPAEHVMPSM
jgi:sporulation protein YlmC with PRC-barrel domain